MHFSSIVRQYIAPLLFPQNNACPLCQRFISSSGCLCDACETEFHKQCLPHDQAYVHLPPLQHCLSVCLYEGVARELVHLLKYRSATLLSEPLGQSMCLRLMHDRRLYAAIDLVIPVPLYPSRQEERGFNQAELLARAMCAPARLALRPALLTRVKATGSQVGRDRTQRMEAMRSAFSVTDADAVKGKCILLVDDVFTTGATVLSCADALYRAGAKEVSVITLCRA